MPGAAERDTLVGLEEGEGKKNQDVVEGKDTFSVT